MNRQWFWYPHRNLDAYLRDLNRSTSYVRVQVENTFGPIIVETDEPRLLDMLLTQRFRSVANNPNLNDNSPRLTYLHHTNPVSHRDILTSDKILKGSRGHTDVAFVPNNSSILLHRPSLESMVRNAKLSEAELTDFLISYSFGLIKSLVNGLTSFVEAGNVGCHGAIFELDGRGVALLGATGSGKSTHALRFLLSNESAILITDDWSIIRCQELSFEAVALERQFFARRAQIEELLKHYPNATQIKALLEASDRNSRIDLDLRSVLGTNRFAKQTKLDVVLCITKKPHGKAEIKKMGKTEFLTHAITSSPHIPFHSTTNDHYKEVQEQAGQELHDIMVNRVREDSQFWQALYDRLPVYKVCYTDSTAEPEVQALIAQLVRAA
jgi:hypothetical protein